MGLRIKNLNVSYEEAVIKSLDLSVINGEFCTLIGHSGTGKSTFLKSIAGLVEGTCDEMILNDKDIRNTATNEREIGFVFQKPFLFPHMTVEENILFSLDLRQWSQEEKSSRVSELLEMLELKGYEKRLPNELSGGQQQRVAIGRAMAFNPSILLMDEPFSSLDPILRYNMGEFLKKLQERLSLTIIFVTHDPSEALRLSDKVGFIYDGQLIQYDTPNSLYNRPVSSVVADFFGKGNYLEDSNGVKYFRPHQVKLTLGEDYRIHSRKHVGKSVYYEVTKEDENILVESLDGHFNVDDKVNIEIKDLHYFS